MSETIKNNINELLAQSYKEIKQNKLSSKTVYVWLTRKMNFDLLDMGDNITRQNQSATSVDEYIYAKLVRYYNMRNIKNDFDSSNAVVIGKIRVSEPLYRKLRDNKLLAMSKQEDDKDNVLSEKYWNKKLQGNSIEI